jgi:magnesium chelatase family protein
MATVVPSVGLKGIEGYTVSVEVQMIPGVGISIVGLPDASVKESKDRLMAALFSNTCNIPEKKIIINLSPSDQKKHSPIFDLAMAIGIMNESGFINYPIPKDTAFLGVLSLDGTIKSVDGMLPAVLAAKKEQFKILYLPYIKDFPLMHIDGIELRFVQSLFEVIESFSGLISVFQRPPQPLSQAIPSNPLNKSFEKDFKYVLGHKRAKRALEIAAAGGHNVIMSGPPGCSKSLLAESFPFILPSLSQDSQFEVMSIYQLSGVAHSDFSRPPFRSPHHSSSSVSLIGGGSNPRPGEVSLAHHGVLFLDEMAEFPKRTLDMLRQPIESGHVTISRASSTVTYPSNFTLIGAMNPCPCGYFGSKQAYCTCTPKQINTYINRVSGPILDRMDILLFLTPVSMEKESVNENESSQTIQIRVTEARQRQYKRYEGELLNAAVSTDMLLKGSQLTSNQLRILQQRSSKQNWSTRVQMKIVRLARTISDLNGDEDITSEALWEAMTLRRTDLLHDQRSMVR